MPKRVSARAAQDEREERQVRKLAGSHHAPADWKLHAQMVVESWAGKTPQDIALLLDCHPQTVRVHLNRFNVQGVNGLGMREGAGRKPRLTELERSRILALVQQPPPGKLERFAETLEARDEAGSAQWSLDALTEAAHAAGIQVERSQIRRIYQARRQALAPDLLLQDLRNAALVLLWQFHFERLYKPPGWNSFSIVGDSAIGFLAGLRQIHFCKTNKAVLALNTINQWTT